MNFKINIGISLLRYLLLGLLVMTLLTNQAKAYEHKLTFAVSGVVESIKVKTGDQVKVGTVLAVLDLIPFNAAKRSADAVSTLAKLILGLSEVRLKQAHALFDSLSTSGEEVERAEIEHAKALSGYQDAISQAEIVAWRLQQATLKAPFSGTVSAIPGYPGIVINTNVGNQSVVVINRK
jgi:membrane fusion protein (multidrug efflux system)